MIVFEEFNRNISLSTNILFMNWGKSFSKKPCNIWRKFFFGEEINLKEYYMVCMIIISKSEKK